MKKRDFVIDSFLGINPTEKTGKGTGYVKNMILRDGALRKRSGWKVIANFRDEYMSPLRINGIFEYVTDEKSSLVVHAGDKIFECDYEMKNIRNVPIAYGVTVADKRTQGYMYQGLLWICGIGTLAIFNGDTVYGVYEYNMAYVPTTSIGIVDDYLGKSPTVYESKNILTRKRKNKMRGERNYINRHSFFLDTRARYGKSFSFTAKFRVRREGEYPDSTTSFYIGRDEAGNTCNALALVHLDIAELSEEKYFLENGITDIYGSALTIDDEDVSAWYIQVINGNELYVSFNVPEYESGVDNIEVEFFEDTSLDSELRYIDQGTLALMSSGKSVLLLCRGKNEIIYSSEDKGIFYFPKANRFTVGGDSSKITGILPMANNYVGVFKDDGFFRVRLEGDKMGEYRVYSTADTCGASNPGLITRLHGDYITVNSRGVFGICEVDDTDEGVSRLYCRSSYISEELKGYSRVEWLDACACAVGDTFYLFIGGRAYATTVQSKVYKSGKSGDEFEYRWWVYDNCPCFCAASVKDTLYMGRESGDLAVFDGGSTDRSIHTLNKDSADFLLSDGEDGTLLVFNELLKTPSPCTVSLDSHYVFFSQCECYLGADRVRVPYELFFYNGEVQLFKGDKIMLMDQESNTLFQGEISDTYPSECELICSGLSLNKDCTVSLYLERGRETEYEISLEDEGCFLLYNGKRVRLLDPNVSAVYLTCATSIECEIITSVSNLGIQGRKSLCAIYVTPTPETCATVAIGYETSKNLYLKEIKIGSYLDFDNLDMGYFSFSSRFKRDVCVSCLERDFDYIRIIVRAQTDKEFGIEKICLKYY